MFYIRLVVFIFIGLFLLFGCGSQKENSVESNPISSPEACTGDDCCFNNQECYNQCKDLFIEEEPKKACLGLHKQEVLEMDQVLNLFLTKPEGDHLRQIKLSALDSIFAISEQAWINRIHGYSKTKTQTVLFWLADQVEVSQLLVNKHSKAFSKVLKALFKENTGSPFLDDKSLLAGMKGPVGEKGETFLEVAEDRRNKDLITLVHKYIIIEHICDYSINQPRHVRGLNDYAYEACVLGVYCYITGSYGDSETYEGRDQAGRNRGQKVRKMLAGEVKEDRVEIFIKKEIDKGGLGIRREAGEWPDSICVKLAELWEDANLYFGL